MISELVTRTSVIKKRPWWRHGGMVSRNLVKRHQIAVVLRVAYGGAMVATIAMTVMAESREWRNSGFFILKNMHDRPRVSLFQWHDQQQSPARRTAPHTTIADDVLERDDSRLADDARERLTTDDQRTTHATAA